MITIIVIIVVVILIAVGCWMYTKRKENLRLEYNWMGMTKKSYSLPLKWQKKLKFVLRNHKELSQFDKNGIELYVSQLISSYGKHWRFIHPIGGRDVYVDDKLDNILKKNGITLTFLKKHKRIIDSILVK